MKRLTQLQDELRQKLYDAQNPHSQSSTQERKLLNWLVNMTYTAVEAVALEMEPIALYTAYGARMLKGGVCYGWIVLENGYGASFHVDSANLPSLMSNDYWGNLRAMMVRQLTKLTFDREAKRLIENLSNPHKHLLKGMVNRGGTYPLSSFMNPPEMIIELKDWGIVQRNPYVAGYMLTTLGYWVCEILFPPQTGGLGY